MSNSVQRLDTLAGIGPRPRNQSSAAVFAAGNGAGTSRPAFVDRPLALSPTGRTARSGLRSALERGLGDTDDRPNEADHLTGDRRGDYHLGLARHGERRAAGHLANIRSRQRMAEARIRSRRARALWTGSGRDRQTR